MGDRASRRWGSLVVFSFGRSRCRGNFALRDGVVGDRILLGGVRRACGYVHRWNFVGIRGGFVRNRSLGTDDLGRGTFLGRMRDLFVYRMSGADQGNDRIDETDLFADKGKIV